MPEISFTNHHGHKIFAQKWLPKNEIKSCILLLHGYAEYSGRYPGFIKKLTCSGHAVFTLDHQGHGRSEGTRGSALFEDLVEDAAHFFSLMHSQYTEYPWLVMGHGLGGCVAIKLASIYQFALSGIILSTPAMMIGRKIPKVVQDMARNIATVYPGMPVMKLDSQSISRNTDVVKEYNEDPLVYHGGLQAGMVLCLQQAGREAALVLDQITIPVWVGHGSFDKMYDPAGSALIMDLISSPDKTLSIIDGLFPEILNEPERNEVICEITNWIAKRYLPQLTDYDYSEKRTG